MTLLYHDCVTVGALHGNHLKLLWDQVEHGE